MGLLYSTITIGESYAAARSMDSFMSVANLILLASAAFAASMLAAVAGFGGAAVLLPLLVASFGVREAIPILTVAQLLGNLWAYQRRSHRHRSARHRRNARHQTGRLRQHCDPDEP